jgi:hypothetical protein
MSTRADHRKIGLNLSCESSSTVRTSPSTAERVVLVRGEAAHGAELTRALADEAATRAAAAAAALPLIAKERAVAVAEVARAVDGATAVAVEDGAEEALRARVAAHRRHQHQQRPRSRNRDLAASLLGSFRSGVRIY